VDLSVRQGGLDPNTGKVVSDDLVEQTEQTFNNIETVLEAAGASLDDVISCLVHLVDLADSRVQRRLRAEVHRSEAGYGRRCARTSLPACSSRSLWSLEPPSERRRFGVIEVPSALGLPSGVEGPHEDAPRSRLHHRASQARRLRSVRLSV